MMSRRELGSEPSGSDPEGYSGSDPEGYSGSDPEGYRDGSMSRWSPPQRAIS